MEELVGNEVVLTGTIAVILLLARQLAEVIGKLIPDSATGPLAMVRKVAKILALYVRNNDK